MQNSHKLKIPAAAMVAISFLGLILIGTALLCLPCSVRGGDVDFITAFFTAASASCVTGLYLTPTYTHWTGFGQAVILILIQIGGLGFITIVSLFTVFARKRSSLTLRKLALQSAGGADLAGIRRLIKVTLIGAASAEFVGAFILCFAFVPVYGWGIGIWQSVFVSVSAFCNAGFTLTDAKSGFVSLIDFSGNPLVIIVVALLIIIGGIGFFVWADVAEHGIHFKKYTLHAKLALAVTSVLIVGGWVLFMLFEWNNPGTIGDRSVGEKILITFFMSVTPRTAGFDVVDNASMTAAGSVLTMLLMLVGGSPGSTAGGIKTVTIAVFFLSMIANCKRYDEIHIYKRRIEKETTAQAGTIVCMYMVVIFVSVLIISAIEAGSGVTAEDATFEVISAIATVGLSRGITSALHVTSKLLLIALMYLGRLGGFTMILIFGGEKKPVPLSRVSEKLMVG